jgi:Fic family protein
MNWSIEDLEKHLLIGSTLVEGSTLSEAEAREVLAGRTIQGHSVQEIRELTNYRAATHWLIEQFELAPYLSMALLLGYHERLMYGIAEDAGCFKAYDSYTMRSDGTRHDYVPAARVRDALADWIPDFNDTPTHDPIDMGADLYARFEGVHPFSDGNGRVGRVLLAYYLHRTGAGRFRFHAADKLEHLRAMEATDRGDLEPLRTFLRARVEPR